MTLAPPPSAAISATRDLIVQFYSDPALAGLSDQVTKSRPALKVVLFLVAGLGRSHVGRVTLCLVAALCYPRNWFRRDTCVAYGVTLTTNNTRAIDRITPEIKTHAPDFAPNRKGLDWRSRLALLRACRDIAQQLANTKTTAPFVTLNQMLALICLHAFYRNLSVTKPRLVVAANDHSPPTVGLFHAARALKIPTLYTQHGPVTAHFPPLYTDLAVLFSKDAAASYQSAAARAKVRSDTQVLILPQQEAPPVPFTEPTPPLRACLALSRFVEKDQLKSLIKVLLESGHVSQVMIARHPRCTETFDGLDKAVSVLERGRPASLIAQSTDFCLVGNSGVALEFLHAGCATYYVPPSDRTLDDYYGFCAAGILPRFDAHLLRTPTALNDPFHTGWRERMALFDPSFADEPVNYRSLIAAHLTHVMGQRS